MPASGAGLLEPLCARHRARRPPPISTAARRARPGRRCVPLTTPDADRPQPGLRDASTRTLAREIVAARPTNFYVNVHNAAHPAGAIRGQLRGGPRVRERGFRVRPSAG